MSNAGTPYPCPPSKEFTLGIPASPSPDPLEDELNRLADDCQRMLDALPEPSPARSDMLDAERAKFEATAPERGLDLSRASYRADYYSPVTNALWAKHLATQGTPTGMAESAPSSDVNEQQLVRDLCRIAELFNGKSLREVAVARAVRQFLARRATAGTTLPTESKAGEGGASALRAEPAVFDLPPLPQPWRKEYERPHGWQTLLYYTAQDMEKYGEACAEATAGAARQGGVTCNKGTSDLAGTTAPAPIYQVWCSKHLCWLDVQFDTYSKTAEDERRIVYRAATAVPGDLPDKQIAAIFGPYAEIICPSERKRIASEVLASNSGAAPAIPEGWQLVPVEPTEEMMHAGDVHMDGVSQLGDAWASMLAAAPSNSPVGAQEKE